MLAAWLAAARRLGPFDAIVIGSDPAFSPRWRAVCGACYPRAAIVHWCFDLYPGAITAEGLAARAEGSPRSPPSDAACLPCATTRSSTSAHAWVSGWPSTASSARQDTLVPWALAETDRPVAVDAAARARAVPRREARAALFGHDGPRPRVLGVAAPGARLSGADGERDLASASRCAATGPTSSRGRSPSRTRTSRWPLSRTRPRCRRASPPPTCTWSASARTGRASSSRRSSSRRSRWAGRSSTRDRPNPRSPAGSPSIEIGFHLTDDTADAVADELHGLLDDGEALGRLRERAQAVYRREWSKGVTNDRWDRLLRELVQARA